MKRARHRTRPFGPAAPADGVDVPSRHREATLVLFFASGFSGLVYEVLWMKELGLLFGNTVQAAATTLAAFFLGLVAGARYWGRHASGLRQPLRTYASLEAGVAVSALLYFVLLDAYTYDERIRGLQKQLQDLNRAAEPGQGRPQ